MPLVSDAALSRQTGVREQKLRQIAMALVEAVVVRDRAYRNDFERELATKREVECIFYVDLRG